VRGCQDQLVHDLSCVPSCSYTIMVYTGKPSRGCGMCKSRRIKVCIAFSQQLLFPFNPSSLLSFWNQSNGELYFRPSTNNAQCDEKRPTCGNCKKSARVCPGYPDDFDLVFRDENKAMAKKARKSSGTTRSGSSTGSSSSHTSPYVYVLDQITSFASHQPVQSCTWIPSCFISVDYVLLCMICLK
jgi:hypothetical protein